MKEKFKKGMNRKVMLGSMAVLLLVAFVAIASFNPFSIDPSRWQTMEFLSDEIIVVAITVFSMVCFIFIACAANAADPKSELALSKVRFAEAMKQVQDTRKFRCWCHDVLERHDLEDARKRELLRIGVEDPKVLDLEIGEIRSLAEPRQINGRYYKSLTERQIAAVLRLRERPPIERFVDPNYYLTPKNYGGSKTISEQAGKEGGKKTALMSYSIISKALVTVLVAIVFSSFVYDMASGVDQAQAWGKFIQRMFSLVTSSFMGYIVGCQSNDIDAYFIGLRTEVITQFANDGSYRPIDQQEEAKQAFIEAQSKENPS